MQKGGESKSTNKGGSGKAAEKKASASGIKPKAKYGSSVSYKKGGAKK